MHTTLKNVNMFLDFFKRKSGREKIPCHPFAQIKIISSKSVPLSVKQPCLKFCPYLVSHLLRKCKLGFDEKRPLRMQRPFSWFISAQQLWNLEVPKALHIV